LVDELESKGLLERQSDDNDRRRYALRLTEKGTATLQAIGRIAREHQQAVLAALSEEEQRQLAGLLQRVGDEQGLLKGVHPGFATLEAGEAYGQRIKRLGSKTCVGRRVFGDIEWPYPWNGTVL
jgi:G:T/U-mismatch repair DNA glycosylase